jgi:hypothetical protein
MKTPHEILLRQHAAVTPKLDHLRRRTIARLVKEHRGHEPGWHAFVFSLRWHFAGISAAWVLILSLNVLAPDAPAPVLAQERTILSEELGRAAAEHDRLRTEIESVLALDRATDRDPALPPRSSERRVTTAIG